MALPPLQYANDSHSRLADSTLGVANPPFHPWRYSTNPAYTATTQGGAPGLQQGYMVQSQHFGSPTFGSGTDTGTLGGGLPWKFRFMYNPSSLSVSYGSPNTDTWPNNYQGDAQAAALIQGVGTGQSLSFSLYLDRTYEVNLPINQQNPVPYSHATGILVDVDYFEKMVGIPGQGKGPLRQIPIDIYFGGVHAFKWHGFVSSATLTMAQFSSDMVPMNAELDITVQQLYPIANPGTATGDWGGGQAITPTTGGGSWSDSPTVSKSIIGSIKGTTTKKVNPPGILNDVPHPMPRTGRLPVVPSPTSVIPAPNNLLLQRTTPIWAAKPPWVVP